VGRHQSFPSGSLKQAPIPTSATKGADFRRKRGYHIVFWKKETTPKTYKHVKAENHNPDEGERKTPEKQLSDLESISLQEKDFRLMIIM